MDGQPAAALQSYRRQLSIVQALAAEDPQNALLRADVADGLESVGWSLVMVGKPRDGFSMLERSENAFERESKVDLSGRLGLASNHITFGEGLALNGRVSEALIKFRAALADYEQIAALPGADDSARTNLAIAHLDIASALSHTRERAPASAEFHRAIEIAGPLAKAGNPQARYALADAYSGLATLAAHDGTRQDLVQAQGLYLQSLEVWRTIPNPGALTPGGYLAGDPRKTARALESCNARLAKLNRT
jgi:tetratricopeptide (TPR) repeat protein